VNMDVLEGRWKEMRGHAKEWWGNLTNNDRVKAGGRVEQMFGRRQQRYGYAQEHASEEFSRRMRRAKLAK
jgi:uncharacterized protein YjbJ (UPF0337 family)